MSMMERLKSLRDTCLGIFSCICIIGLSTEAGLLSTDRVFKTRNERYVFYRFVVDYTTPCLVVRDKGKEVADSCRDGGLETDGTEKAFEIPDDVTLTMSRVEEGEIKIEITFHHVRTLWRMARKAFAESGNR